MVSLSFALGSLSGVSRGQEEVATNFATLTYTAKCDDVNRRLVLENAHTYKSLQVVVRWRAAGGKDLQEQFFPPPQSKIEIGCAAESQIVEAKFVDF